MHTLGNTTPRVIIKGPISYGITHGFKAATALPNNVHVKLTTAGTVAKVAAPTDKSFGFVTAGTTIADGTGDVTVYTPFAAIAKAVCNGSVAYGADLAISSVDVTNQINVVETADTDGHYISAIALEAGDDEETIQVGYLLQPYKLVIPAP